MLPEPIVKTLMINAFQRKVITILLMLFALSMGKANAQDSIHDDDFYIIAGLGTGMFSFSSADSARGEHQIFAPTGDDVVSGGDSIIDSARLIQHWLEIYYGSFGIGMRQMKIFQSNSRRMYVIFTEPLRPGTTFEGRDVVDTDAYIGQRIEVNHDFVTVQYWFPINKSQSLRLGLLAGTGTTEYESEFYWVAQRAGTDDYQEGNRYSEKYTTSGSSTLLSGFIDLTSGVFGARIGWQQITSKLDDFKANGPGVGQIDADVSGSLFFVDLSIRY